MSSITIFLSVLALVTCPASSSIVRAHVALHKRAEQPEQAAEEKPERKMADPISVMRGELCWSQEKLVGHGDCMKWLTKECTTKSMGTGLCNRVIKHVKSECVDGKDKQACHYAKAMGIVIDSDGDGVEDDGDDYPNDPKCQKKPCPANTTTSPPTTTSKPAVKEETAAPTTAAPEPKKEPTEKPKAYVDPDAKQGLQSQGFSGKTVAHVDGETLTSDWGNEYGHKEDSRPKKSSTTRLWQPHALIMAAGAITLAFAA